MGILSVLEGRPSNYIDERGLPSAMFARTSSGSIIDERSALTVSDAYKCIRVLSEGVAVLPLKIRETIKIGDDTGQVDAIHHDLWPLLHDQPNEFMTAFTFKETGMAHLNTFGVQRAWIQRYSYSGRVAALWPLLPHMTRMDTSGTSPVYKVRSVRTGIEEIFQYDEVLDIPGLGYDGYRGYSPINMHRESLGLAKATEEFGATYFGNGSQSGLVATHPSTLSPAGAKRIRDLIDAQSQGKDNWHRTVVLEEGITLHDRTIPNNEAQFLELRKYQRSDIGGIYRVPLHMIGDLTESTNNNIEYQGLSFYRDSLMPWLTRIEQEFYRKLLTPQEKRRYSIRFDFEAMLRGDTAAQTTRVKEGMGTAVFSLNEGRKYFDMNPIEGGDERFIMLNMIPFSKLNEYYSNKNANSNPAKSAPAKDAAELVKGAVTAAYGPVFLTTVEKVVARKQNDKAKFAPGLFAPLMAGLVDGLLGPGANLKEFTEGYLTAMGIRAEQWSAATATATATEELDRAVLAILEKGITK